MRAYHRSPLATWSAVLGAAALLATAGDAHAGKKRKKPAPARPDLAAAVATGDPVAECKAAIAAAPAEPARAALVLPACDAAVAAAPELAEPARAARIAVARAAEREDWSPVELVVHPAGAEVTLSIDAFPGLPVHEGRVLLPAGRYVIEARNAHGTLAYELAVSDGARALVLIEPRTAPPAAVNGLVNFGDGEPAATVAGPPPKIHRASLIPARFLRGLRAPASR